MRTLLRSWRARGLPYLHIRSILLVVMIGVVGSYFVLASHAAMPTAASEAESGTVTSCAGKVSDSSASGGQAVQFGTCAGAGATNPSANAGAHFPISYNLSSLAGTIVYVATNGSDSGSGTMNSPYATLSKAVSVVPSGGNIVVRGGTYYGQGSLTITKPLTIIAYPGEKPVFDGARQVTAGWTPSGTLSYISYTPMPVTDGSGISFSSCGEQTSSCVGKYPDQAWVGAPQSQQVSAQSSVTSGKFWVDATNHRLYLPTSDVSKGDIEVSNVRQFAKVEAANVTFKGFQVIRYSNTASDYGTVYVNGLADNFLMDNVMISDAAFQALQVVPNSTNVNTGSIIKNSTIIYSNWMGVGLNTTTSFTFDNDNISYMNQFNEFTSSPQAGSIKTSRTWYTKVLNSRFTNDKSHAIWFDQSNYMVTVAGNDIENNTGTGIFFEISDYVYAINNYLKNNGSTSIEVSASSDAYLINNTIVGSGQPIGVYTDHRSVPGCSDPSLPLCSEVKYSSDLDHVHPHPATLTWIPGINMMTNNIVSYPSGSVYCGANVAFCITTKNSTTTVDLNNILHPANAAEGVPQSLVDGTIYANGSNTAAKVENTSGTWANYATGAAFGAAMAGAPVNISGFEAHGYTGNQYVNADGSPTATLQGLQSHAVAVPSDAAINPYVPAGTKHYGVLWQ